MALSQKRRYTPALLMLGAGTLLSVVASLTLGNLEKQYKITQFKTQSDELASALQRNIDINLGMQRATGKLYAASEKVSRQEFKIFVEDFVARYPSILGFNWAPRVLAAERNAFEQAVKAERYPTFQIIEEGTQGRMVRARQRPEYFPITYLISADTSQTALGFDLISDSRRRPALEKARDTGEMATTGRIEIIRTKQIGFLTFQPIYRKGASLKSLSSRRQNFQGVITSAFQITDIIKVALEESDLNKINFYLLDESSVTKEKFLSFYQSANRQLITDISREPPLIIDKKSLCWQNQKLCTRTLRVADRQWSLLLVPEADYMGVFTYSTAWLTLFIGLILTALVTGYIMMALRHTMQVEYLVQERTAQAKQLKEVLQTLQQNMQILDLANDSIIIRDLDDKIIYWNQGAEKLYGWKKDECLGRYIHTFLQTIFPKPLEEVIELFLEKGYWEGELIHTKRDGTQIIVASRWTLQRDELGQIIAMLEINNDITDRKQADEALRASETREREKAKELEQAIEELKKAQVQLIQTEKMSSLGQLVAGVAHEINNPVNFIYGNLTHTHEYVDDLLGLMRLYQRHYPNTHPEIEEYSEDSDIEFLIEDLPKMLASMKMGAERIRQIVLSLRNFSRFDEAEMKPVDIHEGIDNTLLILQNRLKAKPEHPPIQVIKEYGNLPLVECYAGQLNQVFMNIIANAIDALDSYNAQRSTEEIKNNPSTIAISTAVVETGSPKRVLIKIADNGPGMTPDVKKRLFDPFFTTKPIGKGTGLGLSISYQVIVEKHDGILRCESELGKGTEFYIEIPVRGNHPNS
ncbi:MAG TPA: CHASE domain-containing protein [Leptolyngbyaceae cyanobacterium]